MAYRPERLKPAAHAIRARPVTAITVVMLLAAIIFGVSKGPSQSAAATASVQEMAVLPRPFVATVGVVGTIAPGDGVDVVAPFDGIVSTVAFAYGDRVGADALLLALDTSEIDQHRNEAESAFLKARQASDELHDWDSGADASRARRATTLASLELADTRRKLTETKALLNKGLIARAEYDALAQQERSQQIAMTAARQDYAAVLRRGRGDNVRVVALELADARAQLSALETQRAAATLRAPVAGIIVRPPLAKGDAAEPLHVGLRVTKGQLLGTIAPPGGFAAAFDLDERDVNAIRPGMRVSVTGPGFAGVTLQGSVMRVAGQASGVGTPGTTKSSFVAIARLDPSAGMGSSVRIGMSCTITVTTYENPSALVVPPGAILGAAPDAQVLVRRRPGAAPVPVRVRIGHVTAEGVEIQSGLRAGDTIAWSASATPNPGATP